MKVNLKKALLTGSAIVAVGAFMSSTAQAQDHTLGGAATWASAGGETGADIDNATAGQTVDVDDNVLTVTNDGTADDGTGLNAFVLGAITDALGTGSGGVDVLTGTANNLTVTFDTISLSGGMNISNDDAHDATVIATAADVTLGGDLSVENTETSTGDDVSLTVDGVLNATGDVFVTAGTFEGANATLTLTGDATANSFQLDDDAGTTSLVFSGTAAQNVNGTIDGSADGEGSVLVSNTGGPVTFNSDIGSTGDLLAFTLAAGVDAETTGILEAQTITLGAASSLVAGGNVVGNIVTGTISSVDFGAGFTGDFTGGGGVDTLLISGGGNIGGAGAAISLGGGDDEVTVSAATTFDGATFAGGAGTDTLTVNGGNVAFAAGNDVSGIEAFNVESANSLTFGGSVTGGAVTLDVTGSSLVINAAGETVSSSVTGTTGGGEAQTVSLVAGTFSGDVDLGDGADTLDVDGGTLSGDVDLGAGADNMTLAAGNVTGVVAFGADADTLTVDGNATVGAAMTGLESLVLNAADLTLEASITGLTTGVDLAGNTLFLNSGGSVDGDIDGNTGAVVFGDDTNGGTFNLGGLIDDADLTITSGTVNTNGFALGSVTALGAVLVDADGIFNVNDDVTSTGVLTNDGRISIGADNTLTATGHAVGAVAGGTYVLGIDRTGLSAADPTVDFAVLDLTGAAADLSDDTMQIQLEGGTLVAETIAGVLLGVANAPTITDSFLFDYTLTQNGADFDLEIAQGTSLADAATTSGNLNVSQVLLQDLAGTTDPQILQIQGNLANAATQEEYNEILESVLPTVDGAAMGAVLNVSATTMDFASTRMASLRTGETGMAAGHNGGGDMRSWFQVFGQTADQDERDSIDGFEADTYGLAVGIDTENISDSVVLGVALSYGNTDAQSRNANNTDTEVDSYQVTLYGDYDFDDSIYLNGMAAYAWSDIDSMRHDVGGIGGLDAQADYDADQFAVRAETGRDYMLGDTILTPNLMANYIHYSADSYTETGAGGANLSVDSDSINIFEAGVGVDASWNYQNADGSRVVPQLGAAYRYDFIGDEVSSTANFGAAPAVTFEVDGAEPAQHTFDAGASVTYFSTDSWDLTADYNFTFKSDYDAHSGFVRANYHF